MRLLRQRHPPETPDAAAIWWATRRQLEPERFDGDPDFISWLADEDNARAWQEIERRVDAVGRYATMPEIRDMRRAALDVARAGSGHSFGRWFLGSAVAASLAAGFLWTAVRAPDPAVSIVAPATAPVQRFATAIGERRDVALSDGSRVTLNTGSSIEVDYSAGQRGVRLLQGQALFHVARNPDRPFLVQAGNRRITALGTAFDVRLQPDGAVAVLLVEGRVRVDPAEPRGLARVLPALARNDLAPGQQLLARPSGDVAIERADVERATAWNRGIVIFRDESVSEAVREMNRYSTIQVVVDDPRVASLKVSGIFPTASREDFLAALEALYPVEARPDTPGTLRLGWAGRGAQRN